MGLEYVLLDEGGLSILPAVPREIALEIGRWKKRPTFWDEWLTEHGCSSPTGRVLMFGAEGHVEIRGRFGDGAIDCVKAESVPHRRFDGHRDATFGGYRR